jgi:hypothetical protein
MEGRRDWEVSPEVSLRVTVWQAEPGAEGFTVASKDHGNTGFGFGETLEAAFALYLEDRKEHASACERKLQKVQSEIAQIRAALADD